MLQYVVFDTAGPFRGISKALRQVSGITWGQKLPEWDISDVKMYVNVNELLLGL